MNRTWLTWSLFTLCILVVLGAMAWFTRQVMHMQRQAAVEENARLALWRMDSALAAILAYENSLQVTRYAQLPRQNDSPHVVGRFERWPDGDVRGDAPPVDLARLPDVNVAPPIALAAADPPSGDKTQRDFQQRAQQMVLNTNAAVELRHRGAFTPYFIDEQLLLLRATMIGNQKVVSGAIVDWPALRDALLHEVRDLLPTAALQPQADATPYRLTVIPASLSPGAPPSGEQHPIALYVAWMGVIIAALAAGVLLHLTLRLSQRRAAFVSAVTHEMRTPLTTFTLYTQMLREGRVRGEDAKQQYLQTLSVEADRLSHLVDNVLAHARLERGRSPEALQTVPIGDLVERCAPRLRTRAEQAGMSLVIDGDGDAAVRAEPTIVEQILLNLVDNACKYAPGSDVTLGINASAMTITDTGPGVATDVRGRLFTPFAKSAQDAASSAPGIGLGLALSRRLARAMGGDLRHDATYAGGARFVLTLRQSDDSRTGP
jgi:signal transduction histidine kinase